MTPWTVAHQSPLSMGFSRQEYWSRLPFPSPGDLSNPGIKSESPALQADSLQSEPPGKPKYPLEGKINSSENTKKLTVSGKKGCRAGEGVVFYAAKK